MAAVYEGANPEQSGAAWGVTHQIICDLATQFNASGSDGLINGKAPGQPSRLKDEHRKALAAMIEQGHPVHPWVQVAGG